MPGKIKSRLTGKKGGPLLLHQDKNIRQQPGRLIRFYRNLGNRGFGLNEVIGIAAAIIIAAIVVIPGLQTFAQSVIDNLDTWWGNMAESMFPQP